jgi:hypothetical protein
MSLVIELSPTEEATIANVATQEGVSTPDFIRKAVFKYIEDPSTKIKEDTRPVGSRGPKVTSEQFQRHYKDLLEMNIPISPDHDSSITHSREDIYFDHD